MEHRNRRIYGTPYVSLMDLDQLDLTANLWTEYPLCKQLKIRSANLSNDSTE